MTVHISARLAWHDSGWNGHICQDPKANTYCVGQYSFNQEAIATRRDLSWEIPLAGKPCHGLDGVPPCMHSINAFGADTLEAYSSPPSWFKDGTTPRKWTLPANTISTWPYEEMYRDEVENPKGSKGLPKYNAKMRREKANAFFSQIKPNSSLIFYYANYSNPFSTEEENRYVVLGMSRIKAIGDELTWTDQSKEMEERYGSNVWLRSITSHYPEQGLLIPYHAYMDRPDILERILLVPENPRSFKYATRHISDDGALGLVERMLEIVSVLEEIGDKHEAWSERRRWLSSLIAELWKHRGLYPGLLQVWEFLGFREAIPYCKAEVERGNERQVKEDLFALLNGNIEQIDGLSITPTRLSDVRRQWGLLELSQQVLLEQELPQIDLQLRQIQQILRKPESASIYASLIEVGDNPYLLCEQYQGNDPDDQITFRQVDNGKFPDPDLGDEPEFSPDSWQRLRALCIDHLKRQQQHTFLPAQMVLASVNRTLSFMPEWKRAQYVPKHFALDRSDLEKGLILREEESELYLYRQDVYQDERLVESVMRELAGRPDIRLTSPITQSHWQTYLRDENSLLAQRYPSDYEGILKEQADVCGGIFLRPVSVLCGAAGTGKTTVVSAIIKAVKRVHGSGTPIQLLAPTGKAADRLRERTGEAASTFHSFLAKLGWLNDNMTLKRRGGKKETGITTYIIDESSMVDLSLLATFLRAVNLNTVQRLIMVGDPNQLPPIGTGKVFADLIDWLQGEMPEHVGELQTNMRQRINELSGKGKGILSLASLYTRRGLEEEKSEDRHSAEEAMLARVQEGGDVEKDLRVLFWQTPEELEQVLIETVVADMEADTKLSLDPEKPYLLWNQALTRNGEPFPEASQVISPYRGDLHGIEHINQVLQNHKNRWWVAEKGAIGGITVFDKVVQVRNRPKSDPIWAYNSDSKKSEKIEVFNGEIGMTRLHAFDAQNWKRPRFRVERFQVLFSRKEHLWVDYDSGSAVEENLELAYAISVHKSQGSEFGRVYFILPKHKSGLLSRELFYTGLTRATNHCTLLVEGDISPLLSLRRREMSQLIRINSSLFAFRPMPPEFQTMYQWYEEGKIHRTLSNHMVRSKSEVIIANILDEREIPFEYEMPLFAPDGTFYLPDFTVHIQGETWYWEHLGMLHDPEYRNHWDTKQAWYKKHGFADRLIITREAKGFDSHNVLATIRTHLGL